MIRVGRLGHALVFALRLPGGLVAAVGQPGLTLRQVYAIGAPMLPVAIVAGLLVGAMLALPGVDGMKALEAGDSPGAQFVPLLAIGLGPVVTALLFACRAGSALTAEVGLMKTSEQLSALEMMGVDPMHRIVAPRFAAGVLAMPLLTALFSAAAVGSGHLVAVELLAADPVPLGLQIPVAPELRTAMLVGLGKSAVFGAVVGWIALFRGYDCTPTPAGVGRAMSGTAVYASLVVLALELVRAFILFAG